jgi:tetratricopeptide (TPR) repeat protein
MTCDECIDLLGDAVEQSLKPEAEAAVRDHCAHCEDCPSLLADLQAIRRTASALDRGVPSQAVWQRIARRTIDARRSWLPLTAAASIVIVTATGATVYWTTHRAAPSSDVRSALALSAEAEIQQAEAHYEKAIAALEQLTANKQNTLDPQVNDAIVRSLGIIDKAIADSRAALRDDPSSEVAQASLLDALRAKTALLQETISLMNPRS